MKKNVALYDPFLDVMGGGERHILSILKVLEEQNYHISIFWNHNLTNEIQNKFKLDFKHITFLPNIFTTTSPISKINRLNQFEIFFYVTNGSYFFSTAKKNYIFCMVPDKNLYKMNMINKLKTINTLFISNSRYTQQWLAKWNIKSKVIYPYVNSDFFKINIMSPREKIILSVGRFFSHLHTKRHDVLIQTFLEFQKKYTDFTLILAGGFKKEDRNYIEELKRIIGTNKHIVLQPNITYSDLFKLYEKAMFFWHFTGFGIEEMIHPEMVEHLGMTPIEAMASGTIPLCYNAGGLREIIQNKKNGFLFSTQKELLEQMNMILSNSVLHKTIQKNGREFTQQIFDYVPFKKNVIKSLNI